MRHSVRRGTDEKTARDPKQYGKEESRLATKHVNKKGDNEWSQTFSQVVGEHEEGKRRASIDWMQDIEQYCSNVYADAAHDYTRDESDETLCSNVKV